MKAYFAKEKLLRPVKAATHIHWVLRRLDSQHINFTLSKLKPTKVNKMADNNIHDNHHKTLLQVY